MGYDCFYPLPKAAFSSPGVIAKGFEDAPIGNGPFKMKGKWQHDQLGRGLRPDRGLGQLLEPHPGAALGLRAGPRSAGGGRRGRVVAAGRPGPQLPRG